MTTTRSFALILAAGLTLGLSTLAGCSTTVDSDPSGKHGDNIGQGGDDTDSVSSSEACGGDPDEPSDALAISLGSLNAAYDNSGAGGGSSSGGSGSGGGSFSSDTIVLQVSNLDTYTCDSPLIPTDCGSTSKWEVSVEIAPSELAPGTFDLSNPKYNAFYSFTGSGHGGDCPGGGGSVLEGQLVIDSVDATAVHFHLTGTNNADPLDGIKPDGRYMATRCN